MAARDFPEGAVVASVTDPVAVTGTAARADGLECLECGDAAVGYWVHPAPDAGRPSECTCETCGYTAPLYDYAVRLVGEATAIALAGVPNASVATA